MHYSQHHPPRDGLYYGTWGRCHAFWNKSVWYYSGKDRLNRIPFNFADCCISLNLGWLRTPLTNFMGVKWGLDTIVSIVPLLEEVCAYAHKMVLEWMYDWIVRRTLIQYWLPYFPILATWRSSWNSSDVDILYFKNATERRVTYPSIPM